MSTMIKGVEILSFKEAVERLGISKNTLLHWVWKGAIEYYEIGDNNKLLFEGNYINSLAEKLKTSSSNNYLRSVKK